MFEHVVVLPDRRGSVIFSFPESTLALGKLSREADVFVFSNLEEPYLLTVNRAATDHVRSYLNEMSDCTLRVNAASRTSRSVSGFGLATAVSAEWPKVAMVVVVRNGAVVARSPIICLCRFDVHKKSAEAASKPTGDYLTEKFLAGPVGDLLRHLLDQVERNLPIWRLPQVHQPRRLLKGKRTCRKRARENTPKKDDDDRGDDMNPAPLKRARVDVEELVVPELELDPALPNASRWVLTICSLIRAFVSLSTHLTDSGTFLVKCKQTIKKMLWHRARNSSLESIGPISLFISFATTSQRRPLPSHHSLRLHLLLLPPLLPDHRPARLLDDMPRHRNLLPWPAIPPL